MKEHYLVAFTGHRPAKIYGYGGRIRSFIRDQLAHLGGSPPILAISGMALGVDTIAAQLCVQLGHPFIAAVPFEDQEAKWKPDEQARYRSLLKAAQRVEVISREPYHPRLYQKRNEWMVDRCDYLIAVWDGSAGGTANCINYALLHPTTETGQPRDGMGLDPVTGRRWRLYHPSESAA